MVGPLWACPSATRHPLGPQMPQKRVYSLQQSTNNTCQICIVVGVEETYVQVCVEVTWLLLSGTQCQVLPAECGPKQYICDHHRAAEAK